MSAIDIKELFKTYQTGTQALKGIDLKVNAGDFFALLGANGAGKTTIINVLTGLVRKTSGSAKVFGHDIDFEHPQAKKCIGVVPQELNFNLFERTRDIILTQAGFYGIERNKAMVTCDELLKRLELWDKRETISRNLSGGMKRRLMIARALVTRPKLLILDEPTAGVDVELRHSMWDFIRDLNKSGTTILLTTHYLEEVEQLCEHAAMIKDGRIIANDKVSRLVRLVEVETYTVTVDEVRSLESLKDLSAAAIDGNRFKLDMPNNCALEDVVLRISKAGMRVHDFRPLGNRMEKLFLKLLKQQ